MEREASRLQAAIAKKNNELHTYEYRKLHQRYERVKQLMRTHYIHYQTQNNIGFDGRYVDDEAARMYCLNAGIYIPEYMSPEDYMRAKSELFANSFLDPEKKQRLVRVSTILST